MSKSSGAHEAFVMHSLAMRESPAWNALPDNARRILDRLEVEHMSHGGAENGKLKCTYEQFEAAGIRRQSIARAIRQCVALGFVKITQQGRPSISDFRSPTLYCLTYVYNRMGPNRKDTHLRTNDWRRIETEEEAQAALKKAAEEKSEHHVHKAKQGRVRREAGQGVTHPEI
jgi:hypothetical protein